VSFRNHKLLANPLAILHRTFDKGIARNIGALLLFIEPRKGLLPMRLNSKITLPLFVFFSLVVALIVHRWGYDKPSYGIDDANIYFVYMKHFAAGHGFV
jgi:hypothetical protein